MRNNTPPHSSFDGEEHEDEDARAARAALAAARAAVARPDTDDEEDDDAEFRADDGDELVYLGDADEVLQRWEADMAAGVDDDGADDDDDDEFLDRIDENDDDDDDENGGAVGGAAASDEPQRDDAAVTFRKHTASVFCGSLHPTLDLAVTGGEDDRAYVWATDTGDVVHEITNHHDTIVGAAFSPDGAYLAIGDMAGEIEVLKLSQNYQKVWEFSMGDMVWMQWHCATSVLMAGGASGEVYVWRIPSGDCKVLAGNGEQSECAALTADGKRLVAGYADGAVRLWDIKASKCLRSVEAGAPLAHTEAVTCVAADMDNGLFLTGGQDGVIVIGCASGAMSTLQPSAGSVEALAFCPESEELKLVACGTLEGRISLWDVGKQAVRTECEKADDMSGVTRMLWAPGHNLMCSTLGGNVKVFDGRTGQLKRTLEGHTSEIYDLVYDKKRSLLLTTSEDKTAKVFTSFLV